MSTRSILLKNGRIIDPVHNMDQVGDVLIQDNLIQSVGGTIEMEATADLVQISAEGLIVCPGFVDLHAHLREPGQEYKETIKTGTKAAVKGGFTSVCAMPNTEPAIDSPSMIEFVKMKSALDGACRVFPIGAVTKERKGKSIVDFLEMHSVGAVAFSDDGDPVYDSEIMRLALEYVGPIDVPIMNHCQDLCVAPKGVMAEGKVSELLGLKGIPNSVEDIMVARDIALCKATGSKVHISHVSSAGSVDLIRLAKEQGINITSEVCPHHLTLTDQSVLTDAGHYTASPGNAYDTNSKMYPPLRPRSDVEALIEGLKEGVIDCIATDHAPHDVVSKKTTFDNAAFGISVFETAIGSLLGLVHDNRLSLPKMVEALTKGPCSVLGRSFDQYKSLRQGTVADIVLINPNTSWVVDTEKFESKGKNTPLHGKTLQGRVVLTMVDGEIVFNELGADERRNG
tara:strand:- start:15292 stop:16653 length:1362 start_codon:yes stop_codon:yes gene_type:complete